MAICTITLLLLFRNDIRHNFCNFDKTNRLAALIGLHIESHLLGIMEMKVAKIKENSVMAESMVLNTQK